MIQTPRPHTALVTGASTGIGRAISVELARRGWRVALNYPFDRERANVEETCRQVQAAASVALEQNATSTRPGSVVTFDDPSDACFIVRADITRESEVDAMFARIDSEFGPLGALINNAGIQIEEPASHETTVEHFDAVLAVNLRGAFMASTRAIQRFLDQTPSGGQILNVSSVHQRIPRPFYLSYAVSKYGLHGMTETLALEYADRGIRVNAIAPGATRTPIQSWLGDTATEAEIESHIPQGRVAEPDEIARIAAFLLSDEAGYITGQTLYADGGLTLYPEFRQPWSG